MLQSCRWSALFVTWTVPNLRYVSSPQGPDQFRTSVGLGFLDVHVERTVDPGQNVTATITALGVDPVGLPVEPDPLAQFGVVYFDEISAYTTAGSRSLTGGQAVTMVDRNGVVLARPVRLNDFAFKTVHAG